MRILRITTVALAVAGVVTPTLPAQPSDELPDDQPALPDSTKTSKDKPDSSPDKTYWKHTFGPTSAARAALGAGLNQADNVPHEWGQGARGFGRRFASSFGRHILKKGIQYPVAKIFHEELSYHRSHKTGFKARLKYALLGVVINHKTTNGQATVNKSELSGSFGSGLLSRLWQPASVRTVAAGFGAGGVTIAVDAAGNVLREFWPEIRHPHSHKKNARLRNADLQVEVAPGDELTAEPE